MEHRICVCVAAIGVATIGHQAQAGITNGNATFNSTNSSVIWETGWSTDSTGINAIGIEMMPRVVVDVSSGGTTVFDVDRPSSPIPFDDPFTSISDPSWSNVDSSGLPPGPERAAVAGDNFIGGVPGVPDGGLLVDIEFGSLNADDAFAFAFFFFEEGEETSQDVGGELLIYNVFPVDGSDGFTFFPTVDRDATDTTRTRADFGMSVIPMPHPAGMAGVGLAGVAMVRRRRSV